MITALLALLNSPLVWFGLLVLSLTGAGLLMVLALTDPDPADNATTPAPVTPDARYDNYHSSNQIGR